MLHVSPSCQPGYRGRNSLEKAFILVIKEVQEDKWKWTISLKAEPGEPCSATGLKGQPLPGRSFSAPEGRSTREQAEVYIVRTKDDHRFFPSHQSMSALSPLLESRLDVQCPSGVIRASPPAMHSVWTRELSQSPLC